MAHDSELIKSRINEHRAAYSRNRRKAFLSAKRRVAHGAIGDYSWRDKRLVIKVPEVLDLNEHRHETFELAAACRANCLVYKKRVSGISG